MKGLLWLLVWGITFGYIEAAVVVYLREIYYPEGFTFPLVPIPGRIMWTEIGREAATLVIMSATVMLAYKRPQSRMAAFAVLFGVWDILYYVFLRLILGWPQSPQTWDILFLIPAPWAAPVWAPMLVSAGLIAGGTAVLVRNHKGHHMTFGRGFVWAELAAALLIVISFLVPGASVAETGAPEPFPWPLFLAGTLVGVGTFVRALLETPQGA